MDKNDVKACLRALLSSSVISYNLNSLLLDFKRNEGCDLPLFEFDNPVSFLESLDDTVKLIGDPINPDVCLVKSEKSSHIISLVERQRNKVKNKLPHLAHRNKRIIISNNQSQKSFSCSENIKCNNQSYKNHGAKDCSESLQKQQEVFSSTSESVSEEGEKNEEKKNLKKNDSCFFEDISDDESLISTEGNSSTKSSCKLSSSSFHGYVNEGMKNKLKNLIKNHRDGLWCCELPQYFFKMYKFELDYREFGYTSLIRMLSELPDVFRCVRPGFEDWIVFDASAPPSAREQKMLVLQAEGNIPQEIKDNLNKILSHYCENSFASELEMNEILVLYKKIHGKDLKYFELGFQNFKSFLEALDGSILTTSERNNKFYVSPLPKPADEPSLKWKEALPPITADDDIFYDLFPSDVVGPDEKLIELDLKSKIKKDESIEVCVAEVWSPAKFYLQFYEYKDALNTFMNELQSFYNMYLKKYKMPDATIRSQQVCVGLYSPDPVSPEEWNRAKILKVINEKIVSICFVDYGTVTRVKKSQLRFLHKNFSSLPVQAFEAKLAGIKPAQNETKWSVSASKRFLDLLRIPFLEAKMVEVDFDKPLMHVVLYDKLQNPAININNQLIDEKLAIPSDVPKIYDPHKTAENSSKDICFETNSNEENSTSLGSVFDAITDLNICDVEKNDLKICDEEINIKPLSIFTSSKSFAQLTGKKSPQDISTLSENPSPSSENLIQLKSPAPPPSPREINHFLELTQLQYFMLKQQQEETRKMINLLAVELLSKDLSLKEVAMINPEFALKAATLMAENYINSNRFFFPNSYNLDVSSGTMLDNSPQRQNNVFSSCNQTINMFGTVDSDKSNESVEQDIHQNNKIYKEETELFNTVNNNNDDDENRDEKNDSNCVKKNENGEEEAEEEAFSEKTENEKSIVLPDSQISEEDTSQSKTEEIAVGVEEETIAVETKEKDKNKNHKSKKKSKMEKSLEVLPIDFSEKNGKFVKKISIASKILHLITVEEKKYFCIDELITSFTVISSREIADTICNMKRFNPKYLILSKKNEKKFFNSFQSSRSLKKKKNKTVMYLLPIENFLPFLETLGCCTKLYTVDFNKLLKSFEETPNEEPVL